MGEATVIGGGSGAPESASHTPLGHIGRVVSCGRSQSMLPEHFSTFMFY